MRTLLIIDMQNAWIDEHPRFQIGAVTQKINRLSERFRQLSLPVIFIQHQDGLVLPKAEPWQIHADLIQAETDHYSDKDACDSFADTNLKNLLDKLGSSSLTICGLATEFCVNTTVLASLSQGFNVTAISDAHTTADRPHLAAEAIIDHHNWVWTNMSVQKTRQLRVLDCKAYLEELGW
jgi:nicotinamidase-related amidase